MHIVEYTDQDPQNVLRTMLGEYLQMKIFDRICQEYDISLYVLSKCLGYNPSTLYRIKNNKQDISLYMKRSLYMFIHLEDEYRNKLISKYKKE